MTKFITKEFYIMKKTLAIIAATAVLAAASLTPCLSSGIMASAATMNTITITQSTSDTASHTYSAYQVFSGDFKDDGSLENIQWADEFNDLLKYIVENSTNYSTIGSDFSINMSAATVAATLEKYNDNSDEIQEFANIVADYIESKNISATATGTGTGDVEISNITSDGYYFIKDTTDKMTESAYTRYILVNMDADIGMEVNVKSGLPTVEKKVKENTKTVEYDTEGLGTKTIVGEDYNDVADYNIGDSIEFELIGSLPENFSDYNTYYYQFTDTMCNGLTLDIAGGSSTSFDNGDFTIYVGDTTNGRGTTVINTNCYTVSNNSDREFIVTFSNLNDIKDINGDDITLNADSLIYVIYTAYLNENAVIGLDGNENEVYLIYSNNPNSGGEDDHGQTPEDKNIVFTYELDTTKIDVSTQEELGGAEFKLYYEESSTKYYVQVDSSNKVTGWTTDETDASVLTSGIDGLFKVIGLDDGTYYLEETKAPIGYNLLSEAVKIVISATTENNQQWTTVDAALTNLSVTADGESGTASASTGIAKITVVNKSGSTIPETGGIGTTIFYVVGGVLVAGAGVLLITKKRAKSAQ